MMATIDVTEEKDAEENIEKDNPKRTCAAEEENCVKKVNSPATVNQEVVVDVHLTRTYWHTERSK